VHSRTATRDLEFMRDRLRLPLAFDWGRRGYYYTRPVEHFPLMPMSESEIFSLLVAHKAIAQYQGTPFERPLTTAFRKLAGQLDTQAEYTIGNPDELLSFRPLAPDITDVEDFEILTRALKQRRALAFRYRNLGAGESKRRHVHPYHLACIDNHWYLFAHDLGRKAMRTFVLTRMSDLEITGERFSAPRKFNVNDYLKGAFQSFTGQGDYEVVVEFDRWATDLIRGRRWHTSQELTELAEGCSRMRLRLNSLEEMTGWVLSWGGHATVIRPAELIQRVGEAAGNIAEKCGRPASLPQGNAHPGQARLADI
jgi:proteasome accessory factor B